MTKKKRVSLRLESDEIAVVGPIDRWEHLVLVYEAFAADATGQEKEAWLDSAMWIREWIEHGKSKDQDSIDEDW